MVGVVKISGLFVHRIGCGFRCFLLAVLHLATLSFEPREKLIADSNLDHGAAILPENTNASQGKFPERRGCVQSETCKRLGAF
jgi:hypothetical protein